MTIEIDAWLTHGNWEIFFPDVSDLRVIKDNKKSIIFQLSGNYLGNDCE